MEEQLPYYEDCQQEAWEDYQNLVNERDALRAELAEAKAERDKLKNRLLEIYIVCGESYSSSISASPIDIINTLRARCERQEAVLKRYMGKFGDCGDVYDEAKQALEVPNG